MAKGVRSDMFNNSGPFGAFFQECCSKNVGIAGYSPVTWLGNRIPRGSATLIPVFGENIKCPVGKDCISVHDTIHSVNAKDYTSEQLDVWATGSLDLDLWNCSFFENRGYAVVKEQQVKRQGILLTNFEMEKQR